MSVSTYKYLIACICSWLFVCMYVLACLIWGCDALVLRRQEALVAPSWALCSLTMKECCRGHSAFLWDAPHATHTWTVYRTVKKTQTKHRCRGFCVCMRFTDSSHMWRECKHRGSSLSVGCMDCCDMWVSWMPRGLSEGPAVFSVSFVKEPRGPWRRWLEHTWQFEPLAHSAGITPNWLWRLAVSVRLEMVCCCALCIGWGFGSHRGRKGFFRNQWGVW